MGNYFNRFPKTFWVANAIELFERWAWYGFFMLFANYLTASTDLGALGFSQTDKGIIMGVGTGILYFLPLLTGSLADRYGFKLMLIISFAVYVSAFMLFPMVDTFTGVFLMYLYLALGGALFKPIISATVARTTNKDNSSIGFGIFYMMVNLGAFLGPLVTLVLQKKNYDYVFYFSAVIMLINFILVIFYKEPERAKKVDMPITKVLGAIFKNIAIALSDVKFVVFLVLIAGFWSMYYQLYFTLPVFISQWVDTSSLYNIFTSMGSFGRFFTENYATADGVIDSEFIINFDAMFIILLQVLISTIVMKRKILNVMISGVIVCSIGMSLTLFTQNALFTILAILIFAIGEMASSPKITEYIGRIAPKDKVALYMGCTFMPVFLGNSLAGYVSGSIYGTMSDSHTLAVRAAEAKGLALSETLSKSEFFAQAASGYDMTVVQFRQFLWDTYHPSNIWLVVLGIGLFSALCLYLYNRFMLNSNNNKK